MDQTPAGRKCGKCQLIKPVTEFQPRKKGGYQGYCRPCLNQWKREYYQQHKVEYIARALRQKQQLRTFLRTVKAQPCADCGVRYPHYVMDFDHREGEEKCFHIAAVHHDGWVSIRELQAEIAKCDLVCANCHRVRTHERRCRKAAACKRVRNGG